MYTLHTLSRHWRRGPHLTALSLACVCALAMAVPAVFDGKYNMVAQPHSCSLSHRAPLTLCHGPYPSGGPSVACSTATAALWDAAWAGKEDPSGRAVAVHDSSYDKNSGA
jgi:hypothetical protein